MSEGKDDGMKDEGAGEDEDAAVDSGIVAPEEPQYRTIIPLNPKPHYLVRYRKLSELLLESLLTADPKDRESSKYVMGHDWLKGVDESSKVPP